MLENKYYRTSCTDVIVKGVLGGAGSIVALWDKYVIDGVVNGVAALTLERRPAAAGADGSGTVLRGRHGLGRGRRNRGILLVNP
jgi:hypothetical protein